MDNSEDINLVCLPGAEAEESTTIFEELHRNSIHPVAQVTQKSVKENEQTHDLNKDNELSDVIGDVIEVSNDNQQIVHSDNLCDSNQNETIENLNFNLQSIDDIQINEKLGQTEIIDEVKNTVCEESQNCEDLQAEIKIKSDNILPTYCEKNGKLLREVSPPPVPLVTYRWEDVRRDKQKGGYPWTYLDPHEPRIIVLSKDLKENDNEEEPELKANETKDFEVVDLTSPEEEIDSVIKEKCEIVPPVVDNEQKEISVETKKTRNLPGFLKRALSNKKLDIHKANESPSNQTLNSPTNTACCHPLVEKLKTMADKQLHKAKQYRPIKKHQLQDGERLELHEPQQILKLKESPKADRKEIASYTALQDSDDVLEIIDLEESPSEHRRNREDERSSIIVPDEIIELPLREDDNNNNEIDSVSIEPTVAEILESELKNNPPPKSPRKPKEHVYEEIDQSQLIGSLENDPTIQDFISHLSLRKEDDKIKKELDDKSADEANLTLRPLSSIDSETDDEQKPISSLLAPISSSIDSVLDDEPKLVRLPGLEEVSDETLDDIQKIAAKSEENKEPELKSLLRRETSPSSDKKVTFSISTEDPSDEPHREDVELPEHLRVPGKWSKMSDHEYEPIGEAVETVPSQTTLLQQDLPTLTLTATDENKKANNQEDHSADTSSITSYERKLLRQANTADDEKEMQDIQDRIEERFFTTTPQTDHSRNDEICTSQVDSSAIEDLPLRREDRKKGFMASTSDKTKNVQRKLRNQAGRLKTKFKEMQKPKAEETPKAEESPKTERKRFRSPEFNKLKNISMPKIRRPELKRPEFTKFNTPKFKKPDFKFAKPEMAFLKKYDAFSSLRKKSNTAEPTDSISDESKITRTTEDAPTKKRFDFRTYPRIFDRMKRENRSGGGTTISRDTEPDEECDRISGPIQFATVPRASKDKIPERPKWASNTSYADDESGKFKHYSLDRESSIEKRMRLNFKDSIDVEDEEQSILETDEQRQFADYDKENRAIHQISKAKEGEFKQRKPLIHQESEVSEISNKELGWVDTDHLRSRLMTQSGDLDMSQTEVYLNEALPDKDRLSTQETQSSGSSSNRRRKGVIEEIDDDEFFLRKKGISQDDIQIGNYISAAIRKGLDNPVNALEALGQYDSYYDEDFNYSNDRVNYDYDVPPRKPRRVRDFEKSLESGEFNEDGSMAYNNNDEEEEEDDDDEDLPVADNSFFRTYPPSRPRRKTRKQLSDESHDEHEVPVAAQYYPQLDEDEHSFYKKNEIECIEQPDIRITYNDDSKYDFDQNFQPNEDQVPPKAPKRRKHLLRESMDRDRDSVENNFVGRSISNSYLNGNPVETVVFRTEHEYLVQKQPETFTTPTPTPRSRSKISPLTDDDRTSRGAESLPCESLAFDDDKSAVGVKEINGYAVVKKEPPPRPPAPVRRKRSTRSLGDRQFFTMPLRRNQNDLIPERPARNYSTIGPTRPARRASLTSLDKPPSTTSDATQYEEIEGVNNFEDKRKTEQNYKMKHRPLPPPPRPPRERKHRKSLECDSNKLDKDGGGEKIVAKKILEDFSRISSQDMEEIEEMERSTQTDPLPDDYLCEEFEINSDMPTIEPSFNRYSKTLEDILKEEQQAELERARQIADENSLTKGIQKFRDANQRSLSERSRCSTNDRPKTPSSRPLTPSAAIVIEKKVSLSTVETDAQLIVRPLEDDVIPYIHENRSFGEDTVDTEDERIVSEALKRYNLLDSDFRDSSPVSNVPRQNIQLNIREVEPNIELNIREVESTKEADDEPKDAPQAPPRRRSSCTEPSVILPVTENDNAAIPEEQTDIERNDEAIKLLQTNRFHINELEVDHLNVHALQAGRILVSDLQAISISSQDIECTAGDLTVKGIKLPPGFIEELINRARTQEIVDHSRDNNAPSQLLPTTEAINPQAYAEPETERKSTPVNDTIDAPEPEPPARPPPPRSLYPSDYAPYSLPPPSFYQLRAYPEEVEDVLPHSPTTPHRRRRHHRRHDSTSDEEEHREHRRSRQHSNRSPEPSIGDLSGQLMRACGSAMERTGVRLYTMMKEKKQEMKRRDVSLGVAILIFVVAFLMMIGMGGERTVHHHHWDYINPPDHSGKQ